LETNKKSLWKMERLKLSQAGKTYLIVFLLIGLLVGVGVGWVAKPAPTGIVSQEEYDLVVTERDNARAEVNAKQAQLDEAQASLAATEAELTATEDELNATLQEVIDTTKALIGAAWESPLITTLTGKVQFGGLFGLTGVLATFGENEYEAAKLAAEHVNTFLGAIGAKWTVEVVAEDTQTDPDIALEKVESFAARGIKLLIGPLSSAEIRAIKGYIDANKILIISQSSTAPDLSIPDDYVYRFCPSDKFGQGPAIGRILYDDGKRYVITVTRNDAWGVGLEVAATEKFTALGGTVLEGIRYSPEATEFSAEASDLASKVTSAVAQYGAEEVAVLHISFEEVVPFFIAASEYEVLSSVKWYGSDGTAGSSDMVEDPVVLDFAVKVGGYPSTIFAPAESAKWELVRQNGIKVLGREPESYSYAIYDIVWAYALSVLKTDSTDPEVIREVLPDIASTFFGSSGWIELDENGDRKAGDYVIWRIVETAPGEHNWDIVGKYILATDSVEWD